VFIYINYTTKKRHIEHNGLLSIAVLDVLVIISWFSINCSMCKQMLINNFDVFVNFTAANSRFLRPLHKCKPLFRGENCPTWTLPCRFETQMIPSSQSRIPRWQNTIFGFLEAQLDFLAKFSRTPIIITKYGILTNLSEFMELSKYCNYLLFMGILARIIRSKTVLFCPAWKACKNSNFINFGHFRTKTAENGQKATFWPKINRLTFGSKTVFLAHPTSC